MNDITFIDGIKFYKPSERAPDFIISNGEIDKAELLEFLKDQPDKFRFALKESKAGKFYAAVDDYKPKDAPEAPTDPPEEDGSNLPF